MNPQSLELLLSLLASGRAHNGEDLAQRLGISRAAIWKKIEALRELGVEVEGRPGSGYALARPIERLDQARIRAALSPTANAGLVELRLVSVIDSTNAALRAEAATLRSGTVLLAEAQTAGRGRRGRAWASPFAAGFLGSVFWRFQCGLGDLTGLSLAVGITLAEAWRAHGVYASVKWPNDLWVDDRKLAGVLIEAGGEFNGPTYVVVGLGMNFNLPRSMSDALDQPITDLARHLPQPMPRNEAVAVTLQALVAAMRQFEQYGFKAFATRFASLDALRNREVRVIEAEHSWRGMSGGIDDRGRLRVIGQQGMRAVDAGEISVRLD